ncbi:MAG: phenylacetate-CoA oxygenase subunit PaaJ [Flavobacteriales bacterium]|nr:MAG: phenylacetate-CoA oxygenase subunit PaaJ [Flavobacteriales bacterium]
MKNTIKALLETIMDPEIPTISIVDLGIVTRIESNGKKQVRVELTPTFSGCPALKIMEQLVTDKLVEHGYTDIEVKTSFNKQWNTNMISEKGLAALKKHGLAPPAKHKGYIELDVLSDTPCPYCNSRNTELQSPFGPTLCRSMHYCKNCLNAFEGFKPLV